MKLWIKYLFVFLLLSLIFPSQKVEAWPGCCSRHDGVCGCGCCDGSGLSSTCLPHYPECSGGGAVPTSKPIQIPTRIPTQRPAPTYKPIPTLKTIIIPTQRPIPTLKPTKTIRPTSTPKPTRIPSIKPSPTEIILPTEIPSVIPTQPIVSTPIKISEIKSIESQSIFSRLFTWMFKRH
jgi:hypothetical protein